MLEDDVLQERIREFKESLKNNVPDMDVGLLLRILHIVNESSEMFVASNPLHDDNSWVKDCPRFAITGFEITDDGKLRLRLSSDLHGMAAGTLYDRLNRAVRKGLSDRAKIVYVYKGEEIQVTDAFSHTVVRKHWAGLPFDIVLASVTEKVPRVKEDDEQEESR